MVRYCSRPHCQARIVSLARFQLGRRDHEHQTAKETTWSPKITQPGGGLRAILFPSSQFPQETPREGRQHTMGAVSLDEKPRSDGIHEGPT